MRLSQYCSCGMVLLAPTPPTPTAMSRPADGLGGSLLASRSYGEMTGQTVSPVVVQVIRPWIVGYLVPLSAGG